MGADDFKEGDDVVRFVFRVALSEEHAGAIIESLDRCADGLSEEAQREAAVRSLWAHYEHDIQLWVEGWIATRADNDEDSEVLLADARRSLADQFEAEYGSLLSKLRVDEFAHWVASRAYVDHYYPQVVTKLRRFLQSRLGDPDRAQQVESDTRLRLVKRARFLDTRASNFEALVFHQANYALRDFWRWQARQSTVFSPLPDPEPPPPVGVSEEDRLRARSALLAIVELACRLDQEEVRVLLFLYRYLLGWTPEEIATELAGRSLNELLAGLRQHLSSERGEGVVLWRTLQPLRQRLGEGEDSAGQTTLGEILESRGNPTKTPTVQISAWLGSFKRALVNKAGRLVEGALFEYLGGGEKSTTETHSGVADRVLENDS